jgi:hypothetical protein
MKTYKQKNFPGTFTSFTINNDDVIVYEKKTLFSYTKELIPLVFFTPEVKVTTSELPTFARILFNIMGIAYTIFFIGLVNSKELVDMIDLPHALIFIALTVAAALTYYKTTVKSTLRFYHYSNDDLSIPFDFDDNDKAQNEFAVAFSDAVRKARISYDLHNFQSLHKGIESLLKQKIISTNFADELHHRVEHLSYTKV